MRFVLRVELPDPWEGRPSDTVGLWYGLTIQHDREQPRGRVLGELLQAGEKPLFEFSEGEVHLYRDDHSEGPQYSGDWSRSQLASVAERHDNRRLMAFRRFMENAVVLNMEPARMGAETRSEDPTLAHNGANFASWWRHLSQEHGDRSEELYAHLREVLQVFHSFQLRSAGDGRILRVASAQRDTGGEAIAYRFDELSHGERALAVLYTLLFGAPSGRHALFLDEPVNYVSLLEIQPWLIELADKCGSEVPQAVLASHHPELINYLGRDHGVWLEREPNGPTRVRYDLPDNGSGLKLAELAARGWMDG
jgi:predicted ATPase